VVTLGMEGNHPLSRRDSWFGSMYPGPNLRSQLPHHRSLQCPNRRSLPRPSLPLKARSSGGGPHAGGSAAIVAAKCLAVPEQEVHLE